MLYPEAALPVGNTEGTSQPVDWKNLFRRTYPLVKPDNCAVQR